VGRRPDVNGTLVIFRREIGAYLRSPVGYLVAAVVLLLDGLLFYAQALGPTAGERLSGEVLAAFFYNASQVLLNTSPLRDWEIVLGKFLSALAFLTAITVVTLYMPLLILVNGKVAVAQILVGYLGLVLLGSAVLAIGVFATALTRHQLVAAAVGSVIVATFMLFWPLSQVVGPPVSLVFAALALHGRHFAGFQAGLLHTRDVFYYLAVTYFFLLAAVKVMEAKRWE
jgi:ABC-2 type transport system permease protein